MNKLVIPKINTQFMIPMIMLTINATRCIAISAWCNKIICTCAQKSVICPLKINRIKKFNHQLNRNNLLKLFRRYDAFSDTPVHLFLLHYVLCVVILM